MKSIRTALAAGVLLIVGGCLLDAPDPTVDVSSITHNDLAVHVPSVIRADDGSFYVFGSHLVPRGPGSTQPTMLWSGTAWFDGSFNSPIPVGSWSHLVMSVDHGTLRLYLNGALVNTMSGFPDVFTPAAQRQFALGVNFWDVPYTGLIDQLKIYDEAVNAEVVSQLYAEGAG